MSHFKERSGVVQCREHFAGGPAVLNPVSDSATDFLCWDFFFWGGLTESLSSPTFSL